MSSLFCEAALLLVRDIVKRRTVVVYNQEMCSQIQRGRLHTNLSDFEIRLPVEGLGFHVGDPCGRPRYRFVDPHDEHVARNGFAVVDDDQVPDLDL